MLFGAATAYTQPTAFSANEVMPGCRATFSKTSRTELIFLNGVCIGMVRALADLPDRLAGYCVPLSATTEQAIRVAVAYIDRNPHGLHEPFDSLVTQAFQIAWPCR
jgi:hypothetical protein